MAVTNFVPDIWSARILTALSRTAVGAGVCNRNYEGDIARAGDSVKITNFVDPTVRDYTVHTDIQIDDIDDATQSLLINQQKYFAFELDDIERAQSVNGGAVMAEATKRAAYGLKNVLDAFVLTTMAAGASAAAPDHLVAEATVTATTAYTALVDWSVLLDQADVPEEDRFAVVSPGFHGLLLKDDRFVKAGDDPSAASRQNGRVGEAAGFDIFKSNNLPAGPGAGAGTSMIAGYRGATTLAEQIVSVEAARMEKRFADMVKGLHVYGVKVTRPTGLVVADVILG
ncbi:P22 coat protein - protein 5 domain protein [Micromonospora sp. DT47]|uniref:P22 coat protein - protein 5 domain protein n=1 Tax=Micromonospora sp. DT47 TaxID=3393431 RepID=UPI003CF98EC9